MTPLAALAVVITGVALAGVLSARFGIAAALVELIMGVTLGAVTSADPKTPWLVLIASLGGVAVTFLAGTQIDARALARAPRPALLLGGVAFTVSFAAAFAVARFALDWSLTAALVSAMVLAETSLAVTYAVLFDLGLLDSDLGRLVTAAVFLTDVAAALALSAVISRPSWAILGFIAGSVAVCLLLPRLLRRLEQRHARAASAPGLRVVVLALVSLMLLAQVTGGVAVLPAFVLGVCCARHYRDHPAAADRLRTVVMTFVAPFFFVRAGLSVSVPAVVAGATAVLALSAAKILPRWGAGYLVARRVMPSAPSAVACLMSTGLTFGMVIALAGHEAGMIDRAQFSLLAAVVVISAVVPAWTGQRLLRRAMATSALDQTGAIQQGAIQSVAIPAPRDYSLPSGSTRLSTMLTNVTTTAAPMVDQKNGPELNEMPSESDNQSVSSSIKAFTTNANNPRLST